MAKPKLKLATARAVAPAKAAPAQQERAKVRVGKAYELLANQPDSLAGLSPEERAKVVVSAVLDDDGSTQVISRVGDTVWDMWPYVMTPNTKENHKRLDWARIPEAYREACQNVLYRYWKIGRSGWAPPGVGTLRETLHKLTVFCRYIDSLKLRSLTDVQPLHIANYVHAQKLAGDGAETLSKKFAVLELLYAFRDQHAEGLQAHPWPESSASEMAGMVGAARKNRRNSALTPLIPAEVAQALFLYAEDILNRADGLLNERDCGERSAFQDPEITAIRDACFYLIGVLTGMRSSELSSIEVGAGRAEVRNGITFHWMASVEHKTKKGRVEYLMPAMGHRILAIMERWSSPFRERLAGQIASMEQKPGKRTAQELQWLGTARSNARRLFLGNRKGGIAPVSGSGWSGILYQFARNAGTDWKLAAHQMRRLYAYTFVRHRLGDMLFLKEQFKHSGIDMTQLYASNPSQDAALYDEILSELTAYKARVVAQWLERDEPLAGGAGHKIMELRAHDFENRTELLTETSRRINIRSTGHSWCLAQDEGCGGSGIYAKGSCGGCHNGLIDRWFIPIWQEAYQHHKELRKDAAELGPGVVKRVEEDLARAARILKDLGVELGGDDVQSAAG
jgi:integrase